MNRWLADGVERTAHVPDDTGWTASRSSDALIVASMTSPVKTCPKAGHSFRSSSVSVYESALPR